MSTPESRPPAAPLTAATRKKLFAAIEKGDRPEIEAILSKTPSALEALGDHNRLCRDKTPLMYAMQCENFELARWLIGRGANVRAKMAGGPRHSVLALAAMFGHGLNPRMSEWVRFAEELIELDADPSEALWPALHAYHRKVDKAGMIEVLMRAGASPDHAVPAGTVRGLVRCNRALFSDHVLGLLGVAP